MFCDNKYTRWYYQIINRAQARQISSNCYSEIHHITPKSLGGTNDSNNLVTLSGREHFIAHWLLTKMVSGDDQKKMAYACKRMMHSSNTRQQRYKITSRKYELLKQSMNVILKDRTFTKEWLQKLKVSAIHRAEIETPEQKDLRRQRMIKVNKSRKGEKRPYQTGEKNHFFGVRKCGSENSFFGKHHSEETLEKLRVPKPTYQCIHCKKIVGGITNYNRWHGNNCKQATVGDQRA